MNRKIFFLPVLFFVLLSLFQPSSAYCLDQPFDHSSWEKFLQKVVNEKGEINYKAAKEDPSLLNEYLDRIAKIDILDFQNNWPREEKLALLLNVYHAGVIRAIANAYPVKSIQGIVGVWENQDIAIAQRNFSLNHILKNGLIGTFRDEKVHTVLFTGAKSSPRLRREAFTGAKVEGQLFVAAREFVNNPEINKIVPGEKKIHISSIFKWHAADFLLDFGRFEPDEKFSKHELAVLSFLAHYLNDTEKISYLEERNYKVAYLPFDWDLNEWH